jgi:putative NIF3 family GTP cyclohydrolase 1 type 2
LESPIKILEVVNAIKTELGLPYVQVAGSNGGKSYNFLIFETDNKFNDFFHSTVESAAKTFAICVGSGASLFAECSDDVDCYITGEMSHHEILDIVNAKPGNKSLILCGHCNSERHFLSSLEKVLHVILNDMPEIKISKADKSPLSLA